MNISLENAQCIVEKIGLSSSKYHNICDGTSTVVNHGILEIILVVLIFLLCAVVLLGFVIMAVGGIIHLFES